MAKQRRGPGSSVPDVPKLFSKSLTQDNPFQGSLLKCKMCGKKFYWAEGVEEQIGDRYYWVCERRHDETTD